MQKEGFSNDTQKSETQQKYKHNGTLPLDSFGKRNIMRSPVEYNTFAQELKGFLEIPKSQKDQPSETILEVQGPGGAKVKLVYGDIFNQIADALVNPVNKTLNLETTEFENVIACQVEKLAGKEYKEELTELLEDIKFLQTCRVQKVDSFGLRKNFKKILLLCIYTQKDDEVGLVEEQIEKGLRNLFLEAKSHDLKSIVIPLIHTGVYNFDTVMVFKKMMKIIDAVVLKNEKHPLKEIIICEKNPRKVMKIQEFISNFGQMTQNQWFWKKDDGEFDPYDIVTNRDIDFVFCSGKETMNISYPFSKTPGTHKINLETMKITDISLNRVYDLKKDTVKGITQYFFGNPVEGSGLRGAIDLDYRVSELIDDNLYQGVKELEMFLKEYVLDFKEMVQINKVSKFRRQLKMNKFKDEESVGLFKEEQEECAWINKFPLIKNFSALSEVDETIYWYSDDKNFPNLFLSKIDSFSQNTGNIVSETLSNFYIYKRKIKLFRSLLADGKIQLDLKLPSLNLLRQCYSFIVKGNPKILKKLKKTLEIAESTELVKDYFDLKNDSEDWNIVQTRVQNEIPGTQIKSLKKICNDAIWKKFQTGVEILREVYVKNCPPNKLLWHGTGDTDPKLIYDIEGFMLNYAKEGKWGRGIYFAESLKYAISFAHKKDNSRFLLFCEVAVGNSKDEPENKNLKVAPEKFDSVRGATDSGDIYIVYAGERAYPRYLVEV